MEIECFGVEDMTLILVLKVLKVLAENTKKYVNNQLKKDWMADQISFSEYIDSFMGEKVNGNK